MVLQSRLPDPINGSVQRVAVRETWLGGRRVYPAEWAALREGGCDSAAGCSTFRLLTRGISEKGQVESQQSNGHIKIDSEGGRFLTRQRIEVELGKSHWRAMNETD